MIISNRILICLFLSVAINSLLQSQINDIESLEPANRFELIGMTELNSAYPYENKLFFDHHPLPYVNIREADVLWSKTLWRDIDTRNQQNEHFNMMSQNFVETFINTGLKNPELVFTNDKYEQQEDIHAVLRRYPELSSFLKFSQADFKEKEQFYKDSIQENIYRVRIKEEWVFDNKRSALLPRIVSVSLIARVFDSEGYYRGDETLFCMPFANLREIIVKDAVYSIYGHDVQLNWAYVFDLRLFQSLVIKERNFKDQFIRDYAINKAAIIEGAIIHEQIGRFEEKLWKQ